MWGKVKSSMVLSVVVGLALTFSGCGTKQEPAAGGNAAAPSQVSQTSPTPAEKVELTISAAASLTDALKEVQGKYEAAHANIKLNFNFGASGSLQQQIEQGAPADLFLSAATKNMKALVDKQLIDSAKQNNLLTNELVAVVPADGKVAVSKEADLTKPEVKKIAIGIPESVPAGSYAQEALTNAKLWEGLQSKTVQGKDVRQVLQYVETGNADAGFVYKTDALTSSKVKIAFAVDPKTYTAVEYPIGIVKATKHGKESEDFYTYLQSKDALDIFAKYGFTPAASK
ncbi:molybdate ABC transporter substrate-binding protein [Paenibacillus doosanensis]|uniref:Molybdate-binding periplasmic protein n=1 Tax=Paenibacillus konkukensis TaxID=2020716 RepID=A0ABY4RZU6_9BACL|nr:MULTISPECIES: molybdate ABC transporter substrate-binding protein [Paenibacillus]MCS7458657.1 molybdate ABC transporter substrate-binding protein [Paenibacillus doosanensis]UQZ86819.1 Molybdate-binding periplasmic protein precursor [Paenibacillus konkukensis]